MKHIHVLFIQSAKFIGQCLEDLSLVIWIVDINKNATCLSISIEGEHVVQVNCVKVVFLVASGRVSYVIEGDLHTNFKVAPGEPSYQKGRMGHRDLIDFVARMQMIANGSYVLSCLLRAVIDRDIHEPSMGQPVPVDVLPGLDHDLMSVPEGDFEQMNGLVPLTSLF